MSNNENMIKFTDGKKEYIWNDNNEIIGMYKSFAELFVKQIIEDSTEDNHISFLTVLENEGYKILEQDVEHEDAIY